MDGGHVTERGIWAARGGRGERLLVLLLGHGHRVWLTRPRDIGAHGESLPAGVVPGSRRGA